MTVYTKEWKKKKAAVTNSKSAESSLSTSQQKLISKAKNYQATITANKTNISQFNESLVYYYKTDKKTKKKVKTKRKKALKPTDAQKKQLKGYQDELNKAQTNLDTLKSSNSYKSASKKLSKAKDKATKAQQSYDSYMKKRHTQALKRVAKQRQQNYARFMAPHASLHATNSLTGLTVFLFASDESESNDSTATTYPIDNDDPVVDHVQRTGKTLTVNAYLYDQKAAKRLWPGMENDVSGYGLPKKNCQDQYRDLLKWQFDGTEMVYKSNATKDANNLGMNKFYYKHLFMTNLAKTLDSPLRGMMKISITFQFAYKAKVTTTSKGNKNNKGHKTTGGKYVGAKYITVKKGMTYWDLAKKYGTTVAQLRKWNGNEKTTMYPDKTGKYPKKLRVTAGVAIKQATEVGTGKIVYTNLKKNVNAPYSIVDKIHRQLMSGEAIMNTDK